ncbi:MAG TPA: lytic transglycosylase domain-containing protein [Terriglobales bacterium]|nr:lytic transglycosylase domain-containing protein [Terriglobales bacterium]
MLGLLGLPALATDVAILRNGFTIRHESRAPLGETTRLFLTADGSSFVDVPTAEIVEIDMNVGPPPEPEKADPPAGAPPAPPNLKPMPPVAGSAAAPVPVAQPKAATPIDLSHTVNAAGERYRLDPDFINSVIHAESGFKVHAVSPKGAQGLMQLMPQTASKLGVPNAFDPEANVDGGTRYLRELLEKYNFDLVKALAAYNAGPHRVDQYHGVPPYRETRHYVASIVRDFNRKKLAQQKVAKTASAKAQAPQQAPTQSKAKATRSAKPVSPGTQTAAQRAPASTTSQSAAP